jgi:hypothetical protein
MTDDALVLRGDCGGVFRCWQCWCGVGGVRYLLVIIGIIAAWVLCESVIYDGTFRYRLTLTVDTPDGPRSGSGVIEVYIHTKEPTWGPIEARGVNPVLHGEAVFVDLGGGKPVIMLLAHGPQAAGDGFAFLPMRLLGGTWNTQHKLTGKGELKGKLIPTIVSFSDLNNPASARIVYATGVEGDLDIVSRARSPGKVLIDRFSETFGPGYAFKRATLEMVPVGIWPLNLIGITGTPVTRGIERKVAWVGDYTQETAAWRAMQNGKTTGPAGLPDMLFKRN